MTRILGFAGLMAALCIGAIIYSQQVKSVAPGVGAARPNTTINATGVRTDLMAIANAEKRHFSTDGKYLSLEDLRAAGETGLPSGRTDFSYSVEVTDSGFRAVATYTGNDPNALHTISINQEMKVTGEN